MKNRGRTGYGLMLATVAVLTPVAAWAQASGVISFHVGAGALDTALTRIAAEAGCRIIFDPALVRGLNAPAVNGAMSAEAAFRRVLTGTNLTLRATGDGQWTVVRQVSDDGSGGKMLSTVRVSAAGGTGSGPGGTPLGANGSTDPIATEGTKSYTTTGTVVASKTPLALKDTPQAISVLTRQQLDDRAINSFTDGLAALPGVTVSQALSGGTSSTNFSSRGFAITNVQIDGGSPSFIGSNDNYTSQYRQLDDLSIYDSVTLLRGAAGTFTGVGSPGGAISLERKRPLDHAMLDVTGQVGSWDRFRGVIDASSPALLDGLIKARAVVTSERNDFFYDYAKRSFLQGYLNVEIAPVSGTIINVGGKISHERNTPFLGLPTDSSAQLLDLPRATCLCTPWSRSTTDTKEVFAQLRQSIGPNWLFRVNTSASFQNGDDNTFVFTPRYGTLGVTPGALNQGSANAYRGTRRSDQLMADGFIAGKFSFLGMGIDLTVGANYQKVNQKLPDLTGTAYYTNYTILPFDPSQFPNLPDSSFSTKYGTYYPSSIQTQYGSYGTIRLSPLKWVHLTVAERYTNYYFKTVSVSSGYTQTNTIQRSNWSPPNFGLVVDLKKNLSLFANYNSIYDQYNYYQANGQVVAPTTGVNIEGGAKAALANGKLNISGSLFYIKERNSPVTDPSAPFQFNSSTGSQCCYLNDGSVLRSKGAEFQIQGALTRRLQIDASYTFTDVSFVAGPVQQQSTSAIPLALSQPKDLVKVWAAWQPPVFDHRLTLGFGGHAETSIEPNYSTYMRVNGKFKLVTFNTYRPGYVTADALVRYAFSKHLSVQLNATNIFDRKYYTSVQPPFGSFYGQPRAFLATIHGNW